MVLSPRDATPKVRPPTRLDIEKTDVEVSTSLPQEDLEDGPDYFDMVAGEKRIFDGQKKKLIDIHWSRVEERLEMIVLDVQRQGKTDLQAKLFFQTLSTHRNTILEQSMVTWSVTHSGVKIQRNVLYHSNYENKFKSPPPLDPMQIVQFPIKAGSVTDHFTVENTSVAFETARGTYTKCLLISGLVEKYYFDRKENLVALKVFDRLWSLRKIETPSIKDEVISDEDKKSLTEEIIKRAEKSGLELMEVSYQPLSVTTSSGAVPTNMDQDRIRSLSFFYVLNRRKEKLPYVRLMDETWLREEQDGRSRWNLK